MADSDTRYPWLAWLAAAGQPDGAAVWRQFIQQLDRAGTDPDRYAGLPAADLATRLFTSFLNPGAGTGADNTAGRDDLLAACADLQARLASIAVAAGNELAGRDETPGDLYRLFSAWVDAYEAKLQVAVTDPAFGASFARATNALLAACAGDGDPADPLAQALRAAVAGLRRGASARV